MATPRPYNFVAVVGMSPAIITETVFEIHKTQTIVPRTVHLITTRHGETFVRALLQGGRHTDPFHDEPFEHAADRWTPFCTEVLGLNDAIDIEYHVPEVNGTPLEDVRNVGDDTRFSNICYAVVESLTGPDAFPLIGSIAGGRKTMGAHLMTAFSVHARPDDRLTHVLVHDPTLERDPTFFYPIPSEHGPAWRRMLDLVDIEFPRVRGLLEENEVLANRPHGQHGREALVAALGPHGHTPDMVDRITLDLDASRGTAEVVFFSNDEVLDRCALTAATAATFAVFAEHCASIEDADAVPAPTFYDDAHEEAISTQRDAIAKLCGATHTSGHDHIFTAWIAADDVSKGISAYRQRLQDTPLAKRMLDIQRINTDPSSYDWPTSLPPLQVRATYPGAYQGDWPFDVLGKPVKL